MLVFFKRLGRTHNITRIALVPPAPQPGRAGLALAVIAKNEAPHIGEWAQFHALAGVSHIYLYDNGSTDGTAQALRLAVGDLCSVIPWDQKLRDARRELEIHNQVLAYAHATRNFGGQYRWFGFIDVDEFLVPKRGNSLPEALAHLDHCRNISLPWHMFGRCGHARPPDGGVVQNYIRRNRNPMCDSKGLRNFKMLVDPCAVTAIKVHEVETGGGITCNDRGDAFTQKTRTQARFYSADHIQLNHYYTRSDEELQAKIARGPNLTTPYEHHLRRVLRKVEAIEADEIEDRVASDWIAHKILG